MTLDQYTIYSNMAVKLFTFMNGKINNMNRSCTLTIDMYDDVGHTFGNIRFPNSIFIHIGTIVDYCEKFNVQSPIHEYIVTTLAWCIAHELFHAEQLLSIPLYRGNDEYRNSIEESAQRASWNWIRENKTELKLLTGSEIIAEKLTWDHKPIIEEQEYIKAPIDIFYMQTIANIVLRSMDLFRSLKTFKRPDVKDIIISFNGLEAIYIKKDGIYLDDNVSDFCTLVYKYCGYYDNYGLDIFEEVGDDKDGNPVSFIDFTILDESFYPMSFEGDKISTL